MSLQRELGSRRGIVESLEAYAAFADLERQSEGVLRLLAFTEGQWEANRWCRRSADQAEYEQAVALLRERLTPEAFSRAWEAGRAMDLEEAIEQARNL